MSHTITRVAGVAVLVGLLCVPPAHAKTHIFVQIGPSAPVVPLVVVPPPMPYGYVWQPAYYVWTGVAYQWVPGAWVRPPHRGVAWVSGRWVHESRGWYHVPGRWRHYDDSHWRGRKDDHRHGRHRDRD